MVERRTDPTLGIIAPSSSARAWAAAQRQAPAMLPGRFPEACMLPSDLGIDSDDWDSPELQVPRAVQLKADGIRALYLNGRIVTREGGPLDCALHCHPGLRELERTFGEPMMFDCEYAEDDGFTATLAAFRRGTGSGTCYVFDAVPYSAWASDSSTEPAGHRLACLRGAIGSTDTPFVGMLDYWTLGAAATRAKAREIFAAGYEGVVTKALDSRYRRARSADWRRVKHRIADELTVLDCVITGSRMSLIMRSPVPGGVVRWSGRADTPTGRELYNRVRHGGGAQVSVEYELSVGARPAVRGLVVYGFEREAVR